MKLFDVYPLFDIEIVKGKGCYTYDSKGNEYLDYMADMPSSRSGTLIPIILKNLPNRLKNLYFIQTR